MKYLILTIIFIFEFQICLSEELLKAYNSSDYFQKTKPLLNISKLNHTLKDSLEKYLDLQNDPEIYFIKMDNIFFTYQKIKTKYYKKSEPKQDKMILLSFDTTKNQFKIYWNSLNNRQNYYFFQMNNQIIILVNDILNKKLNYETLIVVSTNNLNVCKRIQLKKQDVTFALLNGLSLYVYIDENAVKIKIESYEMKFDFAWLFFWWAPRGAPPKWVINEKSRKDFIYTFSKKMKLISVVEVPVLDDKE
jgi:hypothetical protein